MKATYKLIFNLALFLLVQHNNCQYVYTQIAEQLTFDKQTRQVRESTNLGQEFRFSKQYTIWGWFRYKDGDQSSIMNVLNLHNDQEISNNTTIIGPFPNPDYPDCPFSSEQLQNTPNLLNQPQVKENPNCFPQRIDRVDQSSGRFVTKKQDLLYVNFDLVPSSNVIGTTFNLTFLFQNGDKSGFNDMKIEGFTDIPWINEYWTFFAISFDYQRGEGNMYFKIFNNTSNNSQNKTFTLNYRQFLLQKKSSLTIASVEKNNYFQQITGFTGDIAYIEMSTFYTKQLDTLWTGYMNQLSYPYQGVVIDIEFDLYQRQNQLKSRGAVNEDFELRGNYQNLYEIDQNKLGVRFPNRSYLDLQTVDVLNGDLIKAIVFYFKLSYNENLPKDFTLLQRGSESVNGYIRISLRKNEQGRFVQIQVQGEEDSELQSWMSSTTFAQDTLFIFQIGIAIAPSGAARFIYADQQGFSNQSLINDNFNFDMSAQPITLFDVNANGNYNGFVDMYNLKILNSASSTEFFNQTKNAIEKSKFTSKDDCLFQSSYYRSNIRCFDCKTKVLSKENYCADYCEKNNKNPLEKICVDCLLENCDEIQKTTWNVQQINQNTFRLSPTRKLLSNFFTVQDDVKVQFKNEILQNQQLYNYEVKSYINQQDQYIDYELIQNEYIPNQELQFTINENQQNPQFDINRNLIFHNNNQIVREIEMQNTMGVFADDTKICIMSNNKERALKALAITAMTVFYLSVLVLIIVSVCCASRILNLGALWKFLLHNWMKIQLIAFLLFIAINMPCCVKEFLRWIYLLAVSWNHALGKAINDVNRNNEDFERGMLEERPPLIFYNERIEVFFLHNFGVFFIVQGFFFLVYIVLKIWDLLATQSANCFYKIFVFMEFSGLIALFLITAMQTFVFAALNWRYAVFYHSYFVMCFLIAIAYVVVFVLFWLYSLIKLITAEHSFMNPMTRDRYYYFFAGYKNQKWSRTWDHWMVFVHFLIGLFIGLLVYHELSQMILITTLLVVLLGITFVLRPWRYVLFTVIEIVQQIFILVPVILFLMMAIYDRNGCYECGKRESISCWFIVMLFFLAIILGALGLIIQTLIALATDEEDEQIAYRNTEQYSQAYMQDNYLVQSNNNVKNIYNEEVNITNQNQHYQEDINQNNMQNFMNRIEVDRDETYMTNNQSYSYVNMPAEGKAPHELASDSEDEKYQIDGVVRALNAEDSYDSGDLEDSRLELDQQRNHLKVNEQKFYDSVYRPSYDNSFTTEKYDQHKLNNLISNRNIQEETVIRNKKINRTSFSSEPYNH